MALRLFGDGRIEEVSELEIEANTSTDTPLTLIGATGQTANLLEVKNNSGTVVAKVEPDGDLLSKDVSATNATFTGNASVTGNLTVDTNTFHVDATNNRVGIRTSSPSAPLHIGTTTGEIFRATDGTRTVYLGIDSNNPWFGTSTNHGMRFVTNGQAHMNIDPSGRVTMPFQPSFGATAVYSSAFVGNLNPILFGSIDTNIGNNYNSSNGRFTAPISGNYYFYSQAHRNANTGYTTIRIRKNGSTVSNAWCSTSVSAINDSISASVIINLSINDYVDVQMETSQANNYIAETYWKFMGFLIG